MREVDGEAKFKKLCTDPGANNVDPTVTAYNLVVAAAKARSKYLEGGSRKRLGAFFDDVMFHLNRYSRSIDVLIQHDPTVSSLIWGPVRALLEVGKTPYSHRYLRVRC